MPIPASMTITKDVDGFYRVVCGERSATKLSENEALWCSAMFLRGEVHGYLRTDAEHEARAMALGLCEEGAARLIGELGTKVPQ